MKNKEISVREVHVTTMRRKYRPYFCSFIHCFERMGDFQTMFKSTSVSVCFRDISRLPSAFVFLR